MVLTEAVRMAEGNGSPINNVLVNNSVMTAAGIGGNENTNNKVNSPTGLSQSKFPAPAERPMLGGFVDGSAGSSSSRSKQPIYTRDKRTKFTQRENKKWVRLATVLGYLVAVCIPAIALSIYYIGFWDPNYKAQYEQHLREKMMVKEQRQPQQQCCPACACPASSETTAPIIAGGKRDPRHLPYLRDSDDPGKAPASHFVYDGVGEREAEPAYYHNVLMGKNYVIYGAASEEIDISSPTAEPVTPGTQASEKMTAPGMQVGAPPSGPSREKRNHGSDGAFANDASFSHQQHRQHKAQPPR